eukprot:TRINITY_DN27799_c0_g1_i1.p2 TRINITY_DN27799_c0_g1~~TRINITY_DN27799_c0_g1_i1.p2  ORF type:complete len:525 (+),score=206.90 TRINITY_DN27799_c0_g1_i1:149-1723(+)
MSAPNASLPDGIQPIWLDGVVNSEYERDTLPLLFATDDVYNEYYEVLASKNEGFRQPLEMIKLRNKRAREQRSAGYWQECLNTLSQCIHLRRCVFNDDDFQYTAAVRHFILSILNFATFFLKEVKNVQAKGTKDSILAKSFQLFKQAEDATAQIDNPTHRAFFKAAIANNLSNYFFRRRKAKAASQQAVAALKHWGRSKIHFASSFFIARDAMTLCFLGRWEEAAKALSAARKCEQDEESSTLVATKTSFENAPVRFNVQLLSNPMPIADAMQLVQNHNMAVTMIALRRYKEAAVWCQRAMENANSNSQHLAATHPWVRAIRECQDFCSNMSFSHHYQKFRMRLEDRTQPEFAQMQKIINETRTMPIFNSLLQHHRQRLREEKDEKRRREGEEEQYKQRLEAQTERNKQNKAATAVYAGETTRRQQLAKPKRAAPITSLQMYVRNASYKEFVEEYYAEKRQGKGQVLMIEGQQETSPPSAKRRELNDAIAADAALNTPGDDALPQGSEEPAAPPSPGDEPVPAS